MNRKSENFFLIMFRGMFVIIAIIMLCSCSTYNNYKDGDMITFKIGDRVVDCGKSENSEHTRSFRAYEILANDEYKEITIAISGHKEIKYFLDVKEKENSWIKCQYSIGYSSDILGCSYLEFHLHSLDELYNKPGDSGGIDDSPYPYIYVPATGF